MTHAAKMIGLRELRNCYFGRGLFRKGDRLFVAEYENGSSSIVYPVYMSRGGPIVYVEVASL